MKGDSINFFWIKCWPFFKQAQQSIFPSLHKRKMEHEYLKLPCWWFGCRSKWEFVTRELVVKKNPRHILWIGQFNLWCQSKGIARSLCTTSCKLVFIGRSRLNGFVTDNWMDSRFVFASILKIDMRVFKMC